MAFGDHIIGTAKVVYEAVTAEFNQANVAASESFDRATTRISTAATRFEQDVKRTAASINPFRRELDQLPKSADTASRALQTSSQSVRVSTGQLAGGASSLARAMQAVPGPAATMVASVGDIADQVATANQGVAGLTGGLKALAAIGTIGITVAVAFEVGQIAQGFSRWLGSLGIPGVGDTTATAAQLLPLVPMGLTQKFLDQLKAAGLISAADYAKVSQAIRDFAAASAKVGGDISGNDVFAGPTFKEPTFEEWLRQGGFNPDNQPEPPPTRPRVTTLSNAIRRRLAVDATTKTESDDLRDLREADRFLRNLLKQKNLTVDELERITGQLSAVDARIDAILAAREREREAALKLRKRKAEEARKKREKIEKEIYETVVGRIKNLFTDYRPAREPLPTEHPFDWARFFLGQQATFFASFGSNVFSEQMRGGRVHRDMGTSAVVVNQHFPHPPSSDGAREARIARHAFGAVFD